MQQQTATSSAVIPFLQSTKRAPQKHLHPYSLSGMSSLPKGYGRHTSFLHGWSHSKSLAHQNTHFRGSEVQEESRAKHCLLPGDLLPPQITASRPRNENEMKIHFMCFKALFSPWRQRDFFRYIDKRRANRATCHPRRLGRASAPWENHRNEAPGNRLPAPSSCPGPAQPGVPTRIHRAAHPLAGLGHVSPQPEGVGMRGENRLVSS